MGEVIIGPRSSCSHVVLLDPAVDPTALGLAAGAHILPMAQALGFAAGAHILPVLQALELPAGAQVLPVP